MATEVMLIVDDMNVNRKMLTRIFQEDYTIIEARNGVEALDLLVEYKNEVSVMLLDLNMPVMDGMDVLREIKRRQKNNELIFLSIIVVSNEDEHKYLLEAIKLGASEFVSRPVEPEIISIRVKSALLNQENERLRYDNLMLKTLKDKEIRHEKALRDLAEHDTVTGLLNKDAFSRNVQQVLKNAHSCQYVMNVMDVDNFKLVNSLFGYDAGNSFLKYLANNLNAEINKIDGICCRIYADIFAYFCKYDTNFISFMKEANERLMAKSPIPIELISRTGRYIIDDTTLSIGVMMDRAMLAKNSCKGIYGMVDAYYATSMYDVILKEQEIVAGMKKALESEEFEIYLQPQINYVTKKLIGSEALVRWIHPIKGLLTPMSFIPIFERNGFISKLDLYVFNKVCKLLKRWDLKDCDNFHISVNLSRLSLYDARFIQQIIETIDKYGLNPKFIRFEVTESYFMGNVEQLFIGIIKLQEHGFKIEMDDFGSGYSSLNILSDMPVDVIKIDMRFLMGDDARERRWKILGSIIELIKNLDLLVIAEGIEKVEQADYLVSLGCENMQGYLIKEPIPVEDFERFYKRCEGIEYDR